MRDKNRVALEGLIGDDFRLAKTQEGKEYITFSLCINSYDKEYADSTERTHSQTYVRCNVFDKKQIEYLKKVNAHRGQRACVDGRISSYKSEIKGIEFFTNTVTIRDVSIIKTKSDN